MKRIWLLTIIILCFGYLSACSTAGVLMRTAPNTPEARIAMPALDMASFDREVIKRTLEREIYGAMPRRFDTQVTNRKTITDDSYDAIIEELDLLATYSTQTAEGEMSQNSVAYTAVLVTPRSADGPVPIIMIESFCPNHSALPEAAISQPPNVTFSCDGDGIGAKAMTFMFGRYIAAPPVEMITEAGYGIAHIYPSSTFPDNAGGFEAVRRDAPDPAQPWGAVAAWAFQFSSLSHALGTLGYDETIAWGHSRYGKSALLAAAFDPTIDGAIAHQSGTGGASLSKDKDGETVAQITQSYPHWFSPNYAEDTLTLDQHHLLALIAPRPTLLGNAKRDVWSDPEGAFLAAQGATPAYDAVGETGLSVTKLGDFRVNDGIAYWIRPGTHGIVKEDWPAFLAFMDAHFGEN